MLLISKNSASDLAMMEITGNAQSGKARTVYRKILLEILSLRNNRAARMINTMVEKEKSIMTEISDLN